MLEDHLPKSRFKQPGERVVHGQRVMQAASDIFLGWTKGVEDDRHLYWRQLRDMKGSVVVESMAPANLEFYAGRVWMDAGTRARSLRRPGRDRGVPGQERPVRPIDRGLLRALRRPERAGLRGVRRSGAFGTARGGRRTMKGGPLMDATGRRSMRTATARTFGIAVLLVLGLVAGGCGGDDASDNSPSPSACTDVMALQGSLTALTQMEPVNDGVDALKSAAADGQDRPRGRALGGVVRAETCSRRGEDGVRRPGSRARRSVVGRRAGGSRDRRRHRDDATRERVDEPVDGGGRGLLAVPCERWRGVRGGRPWTC